MYPRHRRHAFSLATNGLQGSVKETEKPFYWKPAQTPTWNDVRKCCVFFPQKADAGCTVIWSPAVIYTDDLEGPPAVRRFGWGCPEILLPQVAVGLNRSWPRRTYRHHERPCCRFIAVSCEPETSSINMASGNMPSGALETHFDYTNRKPTLSECRSWSTKGSMNYK